MKGVIGGTHNNDSIHIFSRQRRLVRVNTQSHDTISKRK